MRRDKTPGLETKKPDGARWFGCKLASIGYDSYAKYLASDYWRELKAAYFADEHTPKACICGSTEELELHHMTYLRLGHENMEDLHPLCRYCHLDVHLLARKGLMRIDLQGYVSDLRRSRYARDRRERLARDGEPDPSGDTPYAPGVWEANAKDRLTEAQGNRGLAKRLGADLRRAMV